MSKILLIEPYRMLQHAFVLALFPEHHVEMVADMTQAAAMQADLAIVDGAALSQREAGAGEGVVLPAGWQLPTIWVGASASTSLSPSMVRLSMPFTKEELRTAVAKLLQSAPPASRAESGLVHAAVAPPRKARAAKSAPAGGGDGNTKEIIELVDVFDEAEERKEESADAGSRD